MNRGEDEGKDERRVWKRNNGNVLGRCLIPSFPILMLKPGEIFPVWSGVCSIFPQTDRHGCSSVVWWFHIHLTHFVVLKFSCNILGMFWYTKHTHAHTYVLCNVVLLTVKSSCHCLRSKMTFRCCHTTSNKPVFCSTAWLSYWDPKL